MTIFIGLVPPFLSTLQWGLLDNDTTRKFNFPVSVTPTKTVVSIDAFYATSQLVELASTYVKWRCYQDKFDTPILTQISVRIIVISY